MSYEMSTEIPAESSQCQSLVVHPDELLSKFLEFITFFNQANPRSVSPHLLSEKCQALQKLLLELDQVPKEEFRVIVYQRRSTVLQILLGVYRNSNPGARSMLFPVSMSFLDLCKHPICQLTSPAYYDRDFAVDCLKYEITAESAFPMTFILSTIVAHIPKRVKQMDHWLIAGEDAELLLLNQIFTCITYLHPEICLPAVIKEQDFYTYLLTGICSLLPILDCAQIELCRQSLFHHLQSDQSLVTLFASDIMKFLCGIASLGCASSLLMDAFPQLMESFYSERPNRFIIRNLCTRLYAEFPAALKLQILDWFPIRRHLFIWSQIPVARYPDLYSQPEIFQELYNDGMRVIDSIFTATLTSAMEALVRLPLGLHCLASLMPWLEKKMPDEAPECTAVSIAKQFMPLFRFLASDELAHLPLIRTSRYYLLRLGAPLQTWLLDTDITEIIMYLKCKEGDVTVLCAGTDMIKSVLIYRRIGIGFCEHIIGLFAVLCCHENQLVKHYALSRFCWIATHTPCPKFIKILNHVPDAKGNLCKYLSTKRIEDKVRLVRMFAALQELVDIGKQTKRPNSVDDAQEMCSSQNENKRRKPDSDVLRAADVEDEDENLIEEN